MCTKPARVLRITLLALLATVLMLGVAPAMATAVTTGTVAGTVTGAGNPLTSVEVDVFDSAGDYVEYDLTDASGHYAISGLAPGAYRVGFFPYSGNFVYEFFNDKGTLSAATPVTVTAGGTATADAALAAGGQITGTITGTGGTPLADVDIEVYDADGVNVGYTYTSVTGTYTVSGLPTGSYRVRALPFDSGYGSRYYDGKDTLATADPVSVTAGSATPNINLQLQALGKISGVATNSGGVPVPNLDVEVYDESGDFVASGFTDGDGKYTTSGLGTGNYRLHFVDQDGVYASQYYDGKTSLATANPVPVTVGATSTANVQMHTTGGAITGTVTGDGGAPIAGIVVDVFTDNLSTFEDAVTDANGHYAVSGIPAGDYNVQFSGTSSDYFLDAFIDGHVTVTADATTAHVDTQMQQGGRLSGTVTNTAGEPVPNQFVDVRDASGRFVGTGFTGPDGHYTSSAIKAGSYAVDFPSQSDSGYLDQWFSGRGPHDDHDLVAITVGTTTPGIDAALQRAASVAGTVTDAAGAPVNGVQVRADTATAVGVAFALTDAAGRYRLTGLPPGTYKIVFADAGSGDGRYIPQYYGAASYDTAALTVASGAALTGINAQLQAAGRISGDVTDLSSHPVAGMRVEALDAAGNIVSSTASDGDGHYVIGSLASGSYRVHFTDDIFDGTYEDQYYNGVFLLASATPVTVTAGAAVVGIGAHLGGHGQAPPTPGTGGPPAFSGAGSVDTKGRVILSVRCPGKKPCAGALSLTTKVTTKVKGHKKVKTVIVGSSAYSIAAKGLVKIRIQLSKTGRALLKSGKGHLKTTLTFAISPGTDTVSQSVTLKAAKKKH